MSLVVGSRVGPYEVVEPIGSGGMGEVWRARDTMLGRDVALKVLPADIAHDLERHARLEREAKLLAALNHPNIATLFGVEHAELAGDGGDPHSRQAHVLVMELVEGEGLEVRIHRGPIPVRETRAIALQIAAALHAAHTRGIVHRDLKPANVKIRPDGAVKVLDFGLATARDEGGDAVEMAHSPTISARHSAAGLLLGTAAYMAPEQARGRLVDRRADVWSFGCLLFEMLTGVQSFKRETIADTVAAILKDDPSWELLPPDTPASVRRVMRRCLAKEPERRYQHIVDARLELADADDEARAARPTGRRISRRWLLALLATTAVAVGATAILPLVRPHSAPLPTFRTLTFRKGHVASARFAPDGQTVVFGMATSDRPLSVYSTRADSIESRPLDLPPADIVGVSRNGRMAILLGRHNEGTWVSIGTLAEADLAGGAPRELVARATAGDIASDGSRLAVVREVGPIQRLEYPIGRTLFETHGWISHPRIAPDGERVAFLHHPFYGDDRGLAMLADAEGKVASISPETANSLQGLAWSHDGRAVWFTEFVFGQGGVLWSVVPDDEPRSLLRSPVAIWLQDVAPDGSTLLVAGDSRAEIAGLLAGQVEERTYEGWNDDSIGGVAADGSLFAGDEQQSGAEGEYTAFVRLADGSPPVRLGLGSVFGVSPHGEWVFAQRMASDTNKLFLFPTGAGEPRTIDLGDVTPVSSGAAALTCSADGRRVAFVGFAGQVGPRPYVLELEGGAPRAVGPDGVEGAILSPDGTRVASLAPDGTATIYPVDGGEPLAVTGALPREVPLQWSRDSTALLVWDRVLPARIHRLDLATGRRDLALEVVPSEPASVLYGQILLTPGGEHYIYRYRRSLNALFFTQGIG